MVIKKIPWQFIPLIVCYLFFLIIYLPASIIVNWLALPQGIQISHVAGSFWHGEIGSLTVKDHTINAIQWKIGFSGIHPAIKLVFSDNNISGKADFVWGKYWHFKGIQLNIQADYLQAISNLSIPVLIDGNVHIDINTISFNDEGCQYINGMMHWNNAKFKSLAGQIDLGNSSLKPDCDQGKFVLVFKQHSDAITTSAIITIFQTNYRLEALLTPGALLSPALLNELRSLAIEDSKGVFKIEHSGSL